MKLNRMLAVILGVAVIGGTVEAKPGLKVAEQAIETTTFVVSLPDGDNGSMAVKSCAQCKPVLLRLTSRSTFLLGSTPVQYKEFLQRARGSENLGLNIFYDGKSGNITRLRINGVRRAPAPRQVSRPT
ncbi:MAG TPA: hypothetical protein VLD59_07045 [Steroidobacteraceae bacterium]|nr:hypothetical protein [Steroidobacteraceae bacterium]